MIDPLDDLKRLEPYIPDIRDAAALMAEDPALLAAIMLRESVAGWARGYVPLGNPLGAGDWTARRGRWLTHQGVQVLDQLPRGWYRPRRKGVPLPGPYAIPLDGAGWGRGLMQIDCLGPYQKLIPLASQPWPVLDQVKVACVVLSDAKVALRLWKAHPMFARAWVAAYNAGPDAVAHALAEGRDPDSVSADGPDPDLEGDYGSDVWRRRDALLARAPDLFVLKPPA